MAKMAGQRRRQKQSWDDLEQLYAAAVGEATFDDALSGFQAALPFSIGAIHLRDSKTFTPTQGIAATNVDAAVVRAYTEHYYKTDFLAQLGAQQSCNVAFSSTELASPRQLRRSVVYNEWMRPNRMTHYIGSRAFLRTGDNLAVAFHRGPGDRPFSAAECRMLETLVPHVARAVDIHLLRQQIAPSSNVASALVAHSRFAALVCDRTMRCMAWNEQAAVLLKGGHIRHSAEGRLRIGSNEPAELRSLLARGGGEVLVRPRSAPAVVLRARPLAARGDQELFLVELLDAHARKLLVPLLQSRYGLTAAETQLALSLWKGATLKDVAKHRNVQVSTLRSQLKGLFRKTGAASQVQLVALLADCAD